MRSLRKYALEPRGPVPYPHAKFQSHTLKHDETHSRKHTHTPTPPHTHTHTHPHVLYYFGNIDIRFERHFNQHMVGHNSYPLFGISVKRLYRINCQTLKIGFGCDDFLNIVNVSNSNNYCPFIFAHVYNSDESVNPLDMTT